MNVGIDLHVCMRYVYANVHMHMTYTALDIHIRAYERTHAMLLYISTFTCVKVHVSWPYILELH